MVSTVKYPNFKKAGIPKAAIWITPIIVAVAILIAIKWPESISKMIFVPLLAYALYGLKKNVDGFFIRLRRKNKRRGIDDTQFSEIGRLTGFENKKHLFSSDDSERK